MNRYHLVNIPVESGLGVGIVVTNPHGGQHLRETIFESDEKAKAEIDRLTALELARRA
jgi:hypothetical protein